MLFLSIIHHYFLWHYSRALYEIFHVWLNFLWFVTHFFSIPQLIRSWVAPWKRMTESRGEKWNFEDLAGYVLIGFLSRVMGFFVRSIVIVIGIITLLLTAVGGFVFYALWVAAPALILFLIGMGVLFILT